MSESKADGRPEPHFHWPHKYGAQTEPLACVGRITETPYGSRCAGYVPAAPSPAPPAQPEPPRDGALDPMARWHHSEPKAAPQPEPPRDFEPLLKLLRRVVKVIPRPWMDGGVTFQEWSDLMDEVERALSGAAPQPEPDVEALARRLAAIIVGGKVAGVDARVLPATEDEATDLIASAIHYALSRQPAPEPSERLAYEERLRTAEKLRLATIEEWRKAVHAERARVKALREALRELRINANRLCDRNLGGTYEADCRRSIAKADAALAAEPRV